MSTGNRESTNAIEFSFDDKGSNVPTEAVLQAELASDSGTPPAVDATAQPAPTSATETPADATGTPQASATEDDTTKTYKIKVNGQELVVTEKDLLDGHMRLKDYTQKTQKFADEKRSWETTVKSQLEAQVKQYESELEQLDQFLQDKAAVEAYMQKYFAGEAPAITAPQIPTDRPLTAKEVADIARYNAEQVRQSINQQLQQELNAREDRATSAQQQAQQRATLEHDINSHLTTVLDKFPALKTFEGIEDELMADAARRMTSKDVSEAKQRLTEAAERKFAWAKSIADGDKKAAAAAAAKLTKNGIEPPGGTGIKPAPAKKLTLDSKDRNALIQESIADIEAMFKAHQ